MFLVTNAAIVLTAVLLVLLIASSASIPTRHVAGGRATADMPDDLTELLDLNSLRASTRESVVLPPLVAAAGMQ